LIRAPALEQVGPQHPGLFALGDGIGRDKGCANRRIPGQVIDRFPIPAGHIIQQAEARCGFVESSLDFGLLYLDS
jgi:hypothetical protein